VVLLAHGGSIFIPGTKTAKNHEDKVNYLILTTVGVSSGTNSIFLCNNDETTIAVLADTTRKPLKTKISHSLPFVINYNRLGIGRCRVKKVRTWAGNFTKECSPNSTRISSNLSILHQIPGTR